MPQARTPLAVALGLAWLLTAGPAGAADHPGSHTPKSLETKAREVGAKVLQDLSPIRAIAMYLDGYHIYHHENGRPGAQQRQVRVAHYCHHASEDFVQCTIYDGNAANARLIGIEYVVSDKLFKALPAAEKKYWHPHDGEVDSGMLVAPGIPEPVHGDLLGDLRTTHGKTWHVWQPEKDALPLGEPQLMWSVDPAKINDRTRTSMRARQKSVKF